MVTTIQIEQRKWQHMCMRRTVWHFNLQLNCSGAVQCDAVLPFQNMQDHCRRSSRPSLANVLLGQRTLPKRCASDNMLGSDCTRVYRAPDGQAAAFAAAHQRASQKAYSLQHACWPTASKHGLTTHVLLYSLSYQMLVLPN